jgi:uncharacterized protein
MPVAGRSGPAAEGDDMTRLWGLILLAGCLALPARADETASPETMQAARALATIVTGDTVNQMTRAITAQLWPSIEQQLGGKVDAATLADMRAEFERTLLAMTSEVMSEAPAIYARHFSAQELRDMVAFYRSPVGMKALREMPKVMADVGTQMAPRLQEFQVALNAKLVAIMHKHGYKD